MHVSVNETFPLEAYSQAKTSVQLNSALHEFFRSERVQTKHN